MRGKVCAAASAELYFRITPAHAGKSYCTTLEIFSQQDHPRTCGEKTFHIIPPLYIVGSPPHMRGKGGAARPAAAQKRITPAHAGKSSTACGRCSAHGDHPRTCREKERVSRCACWTEGSPPHMRGKGGFPRLAVLHARITPAHAGKRPLCGILSVQREDHPRTCGEKVRDPQPGSHAQGSPPHMRGKALYGVFEGLVGGITPAHAGKSFGLVIKFLRHGDHPRTCGEKRLLD